MIATSVVFLVTVVFVVGLSLARSFIEAAHDATGTGVGGWGMAATPLHCHCGALLPQLPHVA